MIFVVTPLVVAALIGLGWDRRYARLLTGLMVGLIVGALLTWWAIAHIVLGDRTSGLARMIFAWQNKMDWARLRLLTSKENLHRRLLILQVNT